jgi:hypothetical protein
MSNKTNYFLGQLSESCVDLSLQMVYEGVWREIASKAVGVIAIKGVKA